MDTAARTGRASFTSTMAAVAYSVALLAWVAAAPAMDGETFGGAASLAITAQPLIFSLLVWSLLASRATTGSRMAGASAWIVAVLFLAWSVVGVVSLAIGALPAAVLLVIAVALAPSADHRAH